MESHLSASRKEPGVSNGKESARHFRTFEHETQDDEPIALITRHGLGGNP
jgi:hypothetical protein